MSSANSVVGQYSEETQDGNVSIKRSTGKRSGPTVPELKERCKSLGIPVTSKDRKADLENKLAEFEKRPQNGGVPIQLPQRVSVNIQGVPAIPSIPSISAIPSIPGVGVSSIVPSIPLVNSGDSHVVTMANPTSVNLPPYSANWHANPLIAPSHVISPTSAPKKSSRGGLTVADLKQRCAQLGIKVPSKAKKAEIEALLAQYDGVSVDQETDDVQVVPPPTEAKPPRKAPTRGGPTQKQLIEECKALGIRGHSGKNKEQLINMINAKKGITGDYEPSVSPSSQVYSSIPPLQSSKTIPSIPSIPSASNLLTQNKSISIPPLASLPVFQGIPSVQQLPSKVLPVPLTFSSEEDDEEDVTDEEIDDDEDE